MCAGCDTINLLGGFVPPKKLKKGPEPSNGILSVWGFVFWEKS